MSGAIFGWPASDPYSSYIDREGAGVRFEEAAERRARFGEVVPRGGGRLLQLPTEAELSMGERAFRLPIWNELLAD